MAYLSAAELAVAFSADVCGRGRAGSSCRPVEPPGPPANGCSTGVACPHRGPAGQAVRPDGRVGKSVTPCERMHPENLTAIASADADAPGLEQPDGEQPAIARLAGFEEVLGDPPPHAANPSPTATTAASSAADPQPRRPPLNVRMTSVARLDNEGSRKPVYVDHRPVVIRFIQVQSTRPECVGHPVARATAVRRGRRESRGSIGRPGRRQLAPQEVGPLFSCEKRASGRPAGRSLLVSRSLSSVAGRELRIGEFCFGPTSFPSSSRAIAPPCGDEDGMNGP